MITAAVRTDCSHTVLDGVRRVAPLAAAVALFGVTFGVLARDAGLTPGAAIFFSATTFAGSAQFAVALGALVALALVPVLPVGLPVVAASVVCLWALRR